MERAQVILTFLGKLSIFVRATYMGAAAYEKAADTKPYIVVTMLPYLHPTEPYLIHDMTDTEFDVLDELYFVQPFKALHQQLSISEIALKETLLQLIQQGWVKVLKSHDEEVSLHEANFNTQYPHYYYLATKAGLLAHNSK